MKTSIKFLVSLTIIFNLCISLKIYGQDSINSIEYQWNTSLYDVDFYGDDILDKTALLPNDNTGGLPKEILYVHDYNKYYAYSDNVLIVIDGTTKQAIKSIKISERGNFDFSGVAPVVNNHCEKKMAYNPDLNCIYCATESQQLKVIDCLTDEITLTFDQNIVNENEIIDLYYNSFTKKLYWLLSGHNNMAIAKVIDGNNNTLINERIFVDIAIYKISGESTGNRLFISGVNVGSIPQYFIKIIDACTLNDMVTIEVSNKFINLLHSSSSNRLYMTPFEDSFVGVINCDPNNYSYLYNIDLPQPVKLLCVNSQNNRLFCCGGVADGKLNIIDNDILINSIDITTPKALFYSPVLNAVFCGGYNRIIKITGNSTTLSAQCNDNIGGTGFCLTTDENSSILACANPHAGHVTYFDCSRPDPVISLLGYTQTGGSTYLGCYNNTNKKYYIIQTDSENKKSFVNIYNAINNELINTLVLDNAKWLSSCTYNEQTNKIFITSKYNYKIFVISGNNDLQVSGIISAIEQPTFIYSLPESNIIACGGKNKIYFINAVDNTILTIIDNLNEIYINGFLYSELFSNKLYAFGGNTGKIFKIDLDDFSLEETLNTGSWIRDFAYDNNNYKIYALSNTSGNGLITIINENDFSISSSIYVKPLSTDLVYNPLNKYLYVLSSGDSQNTGGITIVKNNNIFDIIDIPGIHSDGFFLNPVNNRLYFHTFYDFYSQGKESYMSSFDCDEEIIISTIYLGHKMSFGEDPGWIDHKEGMVYNPGNNQLIIGNRGFSNISIVQCNFEKLQLNSGYRWLSFPRMPRYAFADDPYSTISVFENNISYYPQIDFTLESQWDGNMEHNFGATPPWSGPLDNVQSTLGYKLNIAPIEGPPPSLILHGARLYPDCPISLPGGSELKWIGYFIEESQYPWQAFPADVYDTKLMLIKAQYWSMVKDETKGWTITGKVTPIKYGDMVIVKTNQPGTIFFQWNDPDESAADVEVPSPQAFSWEELPDYTPFFIETNAGSDIEEIAVMVNGECMGATVVQPGDTLVEVDGYFGDIPAGSTVEFEIWNGYKSSPVEKGLYIVYNPLNGRKEKRIIYTGERRDYYRVSFKQGETGEIPADICDVSCQPNPFDRLTTLSLRLNRDQKITVNVFDINGVKIKTLINRNMTGGYYEIPWKGDNEMGSTVKKGVYFYKITSAEGSEITGKIVKID